MSKKKLTGWFPADMKPARVGFYQRKYPDIDMTPEYSPAHMPDFWDGAQWLLSWNGNVSGPVSYQLPWRGLAEQPK